MISVLQTAEPQRCCHVTRIFEPRTKSNGLWSRPKKSTCPRTSEIGSKCCSNKGPNAMDWQNLFGPSKILDKFCLCQIFKLSSVGALRHSKIFVYHTEINTIACTLFARKVIWDLKSHRLIANFNASIEYVASAYYCLQSSFQYLALEIQLKRRLRNHNRCSLSKDHYAALLKLTKICAQCARVLNAAF